MRITKEYRFEAAHRLMEHQGACANIHGHSYKVEITLSGWLRPEGAARGMVLDFQDLNAVVHPVLYDGFENTNGEKHEPLDHSIILCAGDSLAPTMLDAQARNGKPLRVVLLGLDPTAEYLAEWIAKMVNRMLGEKYPEDSLLPTVTEVTVWETSKARATWRVDG